MNEPIIFVYHCTTCGEHVVCGKVSRTWNVETAFRHAEGECKK